MTAGYRHLSATARLKGIHSPTNTLCSSNKDARNYIFESYAGYNGAPGYSAFVTGRNTDSPSEVGCILAESSCAYALLIVELSWPAPVPPPTTVPNLTTRQYKRGAKVPPVKDTSNLSSYRQTRRKAPTDSIRRAASNLSSVSPDGFTCPRTMGPLSPPP